MVYFTIVHHFTHHVAPLTLNYTFIFLFNENIEMSWFDILSMGPYGAHHTMNCPCHSTLTFDFLDLVCLDCIWVYWTYERVVYGATSFVHNLHCFSLLFLTDGGVLLLGVESFLNQFHWLRGQTSSYTSIPLPTDHNWHKTGNASIFLQGLKLATPPRPNGLQIPDCLRKDRPMSI